MEAPWSWNLTDTVPVNRVMSDGHIKRRSLDRPRLNDMGRSVSSVLCFLFVVGPVLGRSTLPVQETIIIEENDPGYVIEDIVVEEPAPIGKSPDIQKELSSNSTEENVVPQTRVLYGGNQLWKVYFSTVEQIAILMKLRDENDITMWGGNHSAIDILVKPDSVEKVATTLEQENIKHEILIEDLQKAIDEENPPPTEEDEELVNRQGHPLTWHSYHRLQDIYAFLKELVERYPSSCSVVTIGNSVQGRPIKVIKISNGKPDNKAIWVDGGIHAREWISPATVTFIINDILNNYESQPEYMRNIDWYIAPVLNPDGYEYSHTVDRLWRKNRARSGVCSGTDLNRNFGYRWGGQGSSRNPCAETYGGSRAFSEPETAAVQRFITGTPAKWRAYISFHSYGQYILYPWGYNRVVPPDHKDLDTVGRQAAAAIRSVSGASYRVGAAANTLYPAAGGSDDWAKGSAGFKYAYTIELRDNGRYGFVLPASYINPTAKESLAAVRVIAQAAERA